MVHDFDFNTLFTSPAVFVPPGSETRTKSPVSMVSIRCINLGMQSHGVGETRTGKREKKRGLPIRGLFHRATKFLRRKFATRQETSFALSTELHAPLKADMSLVTEACAALVKHHGGRKSTCRPGWFGCRS